MENGQTIISQDCQWHGESCLAKNQVLKPIWIKAFGNCVMNPDLKRKSVFYDKDFISIPSAIMWYKTKTTQTQINYCQIK